MYIPQVTPVKDDIEKGDKEDLCQSDTGNAIDRTIAAQNTIVNYPIVVGLQYCCCDTRNASIGWFFVSMFLETATVTLILANRNVNFIGLFGSFFLLTLSIPGLIGSVKNTKIYVMVGFGGFVLKAVLNLIALIFIAVSWEFILDQMDADYDDASLNYGRIILIIFGVVIVLFYSIGAVVVFQFMKEIEAGVFLPASTRFEEEDNANISVPYE